MDATNVVSLLGGVALFLFGMSVMGDSLKKVAGSKMEMILYKLSGNTIKGILLGTGVTAAIQSSSATSVMVVGFVNSGMMQVKQAIGIVLGAILGTSITGWILALGSLGGSGASVASYFSTEVLSGVVALVGIILWMFAKKQSAKNIGGILLGFAVLMYGMSMMSGAISPLREDERFIGFLMSFTNPILGVIAGLIITAVIQSASAAVGILQALAMTGAIEFDMAFPILMGIGIGASVPVMLSALGASTNGKRTAFVYLIIDVLGAIVVGALFYAANAVFHFSFMHMTMTMVLVALTNTLYRLAVVIVLTIDSVNAAVAARRDYSAEEIQRVFKLEGVIDRYEDKLGSYLYKITQNQPAPDQVNEANKYLRVLSDFERMSDHARNVGEAIEEISDKKIKFSEDAERGLRVLENALMDIAYVTIDAFKNNDPDKALMVDPLEEVIDDLCDEIKAAHIERVGKGKCTLENGFVFNDLITDYERIADHCSNVAVDLLESEKEEFRSHEYHKSLEYRQNETFNNYFNYYKGKYTIV